jgi:hypothetical protein
MHADKNQKSFLDHILWPEILHEKSLLVYWAGESHDANVALAKMESYFGASVPSCPRVTE